MIYLTTTFRNIPRLNQKIINRFNGRHFKHVKIRYRNATSRQEGRHQYSLFKFNTGCTRRFRYLHVHDKILHALGPRLPTNTFIFRHHVPSHERQILNRATSRPVLIVPINNRNLARKQFKIFKRFSRCIQRQRNINRRRTVNRQNIQITNRDLRGYNNTKRHHLVNAIERQPANRFKRFNQINKVTRALMYDNRQFRVCQDNKLNYKLHTLILLLNIHTNYVLNHNLNYNLNKLNLLTNNILINRSTRLDRANIVQTRPRY